MQVKIKLQQPGYPFLREKWVSIRLNLADYPEVRDLQAQGYHIVRVEADA